MIIQYVYRCAKCGEQATKPPLVRATKGEAGSLGTWRCPKHGATKVKRERAK